MMRRGIPAEAVESVVTNPEQIVSDENGNDVYQCPELILGRRGSILLELLRRSRMKNCL